MPDTRRNTDALRYNKRNGEFVAEPQAPRKGKWGRWLLWGAGAASIAAALGKWAVANKGSSQAGRKTPALHDGLRTVLPSVPLAVPEPAQAVTLPLPVITNTAPPVSTPETVTPALPIDAALAPENIMPASETTPGKRKHRGTRKRGKMSAAFDEALAHNAVPTDGREGERLNQQENVMSSTNVNNTQSAVANASANSSSPAAPGQTSASPAEDALSTQSEGKMAVGEELRDREFPVPPQASGAASQRLVVDQETMSDEGPRPGGAVGTMPGDHQNVGGATDIIDQRAKTPDLLQQR